MIIINHLIIPQGKYKVKDLFGIYKKSFKKAGDLFKSPADIRRYI